jgi:hypothetical protein
MSWSIGIWQAKLRNLTKSADNRAKAGPVFSGNAELGYSLCLKAKSEICLSRC